MTIAVSPVIHNEVQRSATIDHKSENLHVIDPFNVYLDKARSSMHA